MFKDPLFHFIVISLIIFGAFTLNQGNDSQPGDQQISVDQPTLNWLYSNFSKRFQRAPTHGEMNNIVRHHIDSEIKYRASLALGLDQKDSIVQRRMVQKFDFLFSSDAIGQLPEESILKKWYEDNRDQYTHPDTISFSHLYFNPDQRGNDTHKGALATLTAIKNGQTISSADGFPYKTSYESINPSDLRKLFGGHFSSRLFSIGQTGWFGPIQSGLGTHLVEITHWQKGEPLAYEAVRGAVLKAWRSAENTRLLEQRLDNLKSNYHIDIDKNALSGFDYSQNASAQEG